MPDVMAPVEITPFIPADASIADLCQLLIACEKMQHRYQWSSGFIIVTMMQRPEAPKNLAEFVGWLRHHTGLLLSQSEVKRRMDVFQFYSKFSDSRIIGLVERSGVKLAYRARRVITDEEQARTVLEACVANPGAIDDVLHQFGEKRYRAAKRTIRVNQKDVNDLEGHLRDGVYRFANEDWVPLSVVRAFLDKLQ